MAGLLQEPCDTLTPQVVDGVGEMTNIIAGGIKRGLTGTPWAFGNVTVLMVTFPFAGTLLIFAGLAIFHFLGKPEDVSDGDQQTKR